MRKIIVVVCLLWCLGANAQQSYIYLEPIKGIPCKIVMNQKEVSTLTKNYFLIPIAGNGEYTFDIVFGGDLHPKQTFVVDVVEGSAYGYKLAKTNENKFYLLDLINNGKIIETNTPVNLGLTTESNLINFFDPSIQKPEDISKAEARRRNKLEKAKAKAKSLEQQDKAVMPDVKEPAKTQTEYGVVEVIRPIPDKSEKASTAVGNARCNVASSTQEVNAFVDRLNQKNDDESKLILVRKKSFTGCLTCQQVYSMVDVLKTQYGRFSAIKIFRSIISDPENIIQLEPLFKTDSYKSKLQEL